MTDKAAIGRASPTRILTALRKFIAALDRRVPRRERSGEGKIAGDAAGYDHQLVDAIMTDDGGPMPEPREART